MTIPLALERLAEKVGGYGPLAYLLTTSPDGRPHATAADPVFTDAGRIVLGAGRRSSANVAERPLVSVLWPPSEPGGYTLIVDGEGVAGEGEVTITPTKGVLHRPAAGRGDGPGCTADCVPLYTDGAPAAQFP